MGRHGPMNVAQACPISGRCPQVDAESCGRHVVTASRLTRTKNSLQLGHVRFLNDATQLGGQLTY